LLCLEFQGGLIFPIWLMGKRVLWTLDSTTFSGWGRRSTACGLNNTSNFVVCNYLH